MLGIHSYCLLEHELRMLVRQFVHFNDVPILEIIWFCANTSNVKSNSIGWKSKPKATARVILIFFLPLMFTLIKKDDV